jgi:oligopeptidase B
LARSLLRGYFFPGFPIVFCCVKVFGGIIASVPFVDVLNTMSDESLPLTPPEWLEWGNPILDESAFKAIAAYSPYDNVSAQNYPPILVEGGLTDPRVTYWEPAKWVAKIRAMRTNRNPLFLHCDMETGHGGASGRFQAYRDVAMEYAFLLGLDQGLLTSEVQ